ncbi:MAG: sodium:proton antiporter [Thiotrichaceae bacterium]|nr:sodium:proton antiporter [Thiotrichaceae bacterium]
MDYPILAIVPPLLAIILAILTRDVVLSLLIGLFSGHFILQDFSFFTAFTHLFDGILQVMAKSWVTKTIIFALLVGSILRLIVDSHGVEGFVHFLTQKHRLIRSPRGALLLAYFIGIVIFIESSISSLLSGSVARPISDKYKVSHEKLAYVCDSTSAPVCSLIALNGWGALLVGLLLTQAEAGLINESPIAFFIHSIPYNFYAWISLALVLIVILFNINIGPMKRYEQNAKTMNTSNSTDPININQKPQGAMHYMLLPLMVLIATIPMALYFDGKGNILNGSGTTAVFYAVIASLSFTFIYYLTTKVMTKEQFYKSFYGGIADMIPITLILILAFAIGSMTNELNTGKYLAELAENYMTPSLIPVAIFILAAVISFSTGTSWGTFSIIVPIAIPMAVATDAPLALTMGAVVSGGIFGDHASPLSDTSLISSLAAKCDHINHVTSQLPYALIAGGLAAILFIGFGVLS